MNFIFAGLLCGLLMIPISFKHLLVICEEISLKMQENYLFNVYGLRCINNISYNTE